MSGGWPVIGLMLGDVTGVGPEVCAKVIASAAGSDIERVIVVGDARVLELGMRDAGVSLDYRVCEGIGDVRWPSDVLQLVDLRNLDPRGIRRGGVSPESGHACGETLAHMIGLARAGALDGICFAPLCKAALHAGDWKFPDEHQMFAKLIGHDGVFGEMNVLPEFSTFRVTSHVSLRNAIDLVTPERISRVVRLADRTLRALGHEDPRIAVAALNPHGGEGGLFGDEEIRIIRLTVEALQAEGIDATGPLPSDTIFLRAKRGEFDGVVMMYHDQGQIATKLLGFNRGVTVTAGLDTVFTTPAQGTAFDIVGRGTADPTGLEHALRLAARLARGLGTVPPA